MTDGDPNEAYEIEHSVPKTVPQEWVTLKANGIAWWYGPLSVCQKLAADPEARKEARRSKMHHDRKPA